MLGGGVLAGEEEMEDTGNIFCVTLWGQGLKQKKHLRPNPLNLIHVISENEKKLESAYTWSFLRCVPFFVEVCSNKSMNITFFIISFVI